MFMVLSYYLFTLHIRIFSIPIGIRFFAPSEEFRKTQIDWETEEKKPVSVPNPSKISIMSHFKSASRFEINGLLIATFKMKLKYLSLISIADLPINISRSLIIFFLDRYRLNSEYV